MVNILLKKIKELENKINIIEQNNNEAKEILLELFKKCKIDKNKKEKFKEKFKKAILKLEISNIEKFFSENGLKYNSFLEILKTVNNGYLVIIDANYSDDIKKFILGYMVNKISPFFTLDKNMVIGLIDDKQLKELKNLKDMSYYDVITGEFNDIEIYKMFFESDSFTITEVEKAKKIFQEYRKRPAYKNKHFIEYSLPKNKITDFEEDKLNKQKEKYSYIYDEKYPNLEYKLKKEIKNIPFVLAVLERIDTELDDIKESKGIINIVNRMLNYIELNLSEKGINEQIKILREKLKD